MDCKLALSMTNVQNSSKAYQYFVEKSAELQSKKDSISTKRDQIKCYEDIITWLALIKDDTDMDKNGFESIIDFLPKEASEMRNEVTISVNWIQKCTTVTPYYVTIIIISDLIIPLQENELDAMMPKAVSMKDGPIMTAMEKTLQEIGVQRQAYHGHSFVGNHVHACCKVSYYHSVDWFRIINYKM